MKIIRKEGGLPPVCDMKRSEQKVENTWKMEDIYASMEAYNADVQKVQALLKEYEALQGTLGKDAEYLLRALMLDEQISMIYSELAVYANQRYHEDTGNAVYQKLTGEVQTLGVQMMQSISWFQPELLALPEARLTQYYAEEPKLEGYRRQIEEVTRMRDHILDTKTEELLARMSELADAPANIFSMFNNADIRFPDVEDANGEKHTLTIGSYISYMESRDRTLRENAFHALYSVYRQYRNTIAAMYYANAKQADVMAKEHHYDNAMQQALDASAIPVSVYENLIGTINRRLPAMYRYVELRKKLLGVETLHMYDNYVPMVDCPDQKYSFEEAKEIVLRGLAPLGADYQELLQKGFGGRWIDIYENEGKRTGAYSWGTYQSHPYVLLNYHGTLADVFTLAHEMGHSIHSWYSNHTQPYRYSGYRIFVAEVASTCNEALLIHDLLDRTEDETERRYLINYFLDQFKSTMFRQTMFAEFERDTHAAVQRGETLTSEALCSAYYELNCRYFGEAMEADEDIAFEWQRIPHFYTPFYVYQYATGFAAAIAISSKILSGEPGIVENYKRFLSGGSSMDPIDLLKLCGVDMSSPEPVERALDVFEEYLEKLEKAGKF